MNEQKTLLSFDHRVLDLCDGRAHICGKILGDLGADVIQIERPGGDPARNIGPFYNDIPNPEKSLWWFAFNMNKRGITLNIETVDGREIFKGGGASLEPIENLFLYNSIIDENSRKEFKEINEHEIIVQIAQLLGSCPSYIKKAEEIFNKLKYLIANHVIHHEFDAQGSVNSDLLLWLDSKSNPDNAEKFSNFISKYL